MSHSCPDPCLLHAQSRRHEAARRKRIGDVDADEIWTNLIVLLLTFDRNDRSFHGSEHVLDRCVHAVRRQRNSGKHDSAIGSRSRVSSFRLANVQCSRFGEFRFFGRWDESDAANDLSGMGQQSTGIRQPGLVRDPSPVLLLRREAADEQEVQSDVLEKHRDNTAAEKSKSFEVVGLVHGPAMYM